MPTPPAARLAPLAACVALLACQPVPPDPAAPLPPVAGAEPGAAPVVAVTDPMGPPGTASLPETWPRAFFCAPLQPAPRPPPYCTRSIGAVDCWVQPPLTMPPRPGLADGRASLTPAQDAQRRQCWPGVL